MVIRTKEGDWMSTLTFTFTESNRKVLTKNGSDVEAVDGGVEAAGGGFETGGVGTEHRPE